MAKKTKKVQKKVVTKKKTATKKAAPKKTAAKKTKKSSAANKEALFVASKVKAYIKQNDKMTSGETLDALNEKIYAMLDAAVKRTEDNGRKTVKPQDL